MRQKRRFIARNYGVSATSYGLLLGLIAILAITALISVGEEVRTIFLHVGEAIQIESPSSSSPDEETGSDPEPEFDPDNTPPTAGSPDITIFQGVEITLLDEEILDGSNDPDDDPLTISAVTSGPNVTATAVDGKAVIVGTNPGSGSFGFTISDGRGGFDTGTASVTILPEVRFTAADAFPDQRFGWDVALEGNRVVIGAPDNSSSTPGAVYIFEKSGGIWSQTQKIEPATGVNGDRFGMQVELQGNRLAVGAPGRNSNRGVVFVFEYTGGSFQEVAELSPTVANATAGMGSGLGMDGDIIVAASRLGGGNDAWAFHFDGANWNEEQKLVPLLGSTHSFYGSSVVIRDDMLAIGDSQGSSNTGYMHVYDRDTERSPGNVWQGLSSNAQTAPFVTGTFPKFSIGIDFDLFTSRMLVGANGESFMGVEGGGAVWPHHWDGSQWIASTANPFFPAQMTSDNFAYAFGTTIKMDGDRAVIAAVADRVETGSGTIGIQTGSVFVYERSGSNWIELAKIYASDAASFSSFGSAIDFEDPAVLVGAQGYDRGIANANYGAAYLYEDYAPFQP